MTYNVEYELSWPRCGSESKVVKGKDGKTARPRTHG